MTVKHEVDAIIHTMDYIATAAKVAVVGSRSFDDYRLLCETLDQFSDIECIISGGAIGADSLAARYAKEHNITLKVYVPDWSLGKHAGMLRNTLIVDRCDVVIAFWDGESKGTNDSINKAKKMNKPCKIVYSLNNSLSFD